MDMASKRYMARLIRTITTVGVLIHCVCFCDARPPPMGPPPMSPPLIGCEITLEDGLKSSKTVYKTKYLVRKADFVGKIEVTEFLKYDAEVKVLAVYKDSTEQIKVGDQLSLVGVNSPSTCSSNWILSNRGSKGFVFAKKIQGKDNNQFQLMNFGIQEV
jgi:hypothetical protein